MTKTTTKPATKVVQSDADFLATREKEILKKYKRVNPGTIRRETDGTHAGKITVELRCSTKGCDKVRRVATSDLFQVKACLECTAANRSKKRRAAKAAVAKSGETVTKTVKVKTKAKGGSKKTKLAVPSFAKANGLAHGNPDAQEDTGMTALPDDVAVLPEHEAVPVS